MDKFGTPAEGFNIVCTTYRLTEHYHYWTKNNPMNVQLVPEPFVEIPEELAQEKGIKGGDKVKVTSARSSVHGEGDGDQAHPAHEDRREDHLPDRHSHPLGLQGHCRRARARRH